MFHEHPLNNRIIASLLRYFHYNIVNYKKIAQKKCPEPESNQRHEDFQSSALPTELSGHLKLTETNSCKFVVAGTGFEPVTFGL